MAGDGLTNCLLTGFRCNRNKKNLLHLLYFSKIVVYLNSGMSVYVMFLFQNGLNDFNKIFYVYLWDHLESPNLL